MINGFRVTQHRSQWINKLCSFSPRPLIIRLLGCPLGIVGKKGYLMAKPSWSWSGKGLWFISDGNLFLQGILIKYYKISHARDRGLKSSIDEQKPQRQKRVSSVSMFSARGVYRWMDYSVCQTSNYKAPCSTRLSSRDSIKSRAAVVNSCCSLLTCYFPLICVWFFFLVCVLINFNPEDMVSLLQPV